MTNAVGYYHNEREERLSPDAQSKFGQRSIDINRDFPYNNDPEECLNSIAARVIYQIFTKNNIVASLTFHGGCNNIGFPWGSYNHSYKTGHNSY